MGVDEGNLSTSIDRYWKIVFLPFDHGLDF